MANVIILGDGPHAKVVKNCLAKDNHEILGSFGAEHEKELQLLIDLLVSRNIEYAFHIAVGDNKVRSLIALKHSKTLFVTAVSSTAQVDSTVKIGDGSYVAPLTYIGLDAQVGQHSIINTGALIDHDVRVRDFSHIAGNAYIAGGVSIGDRVFVGAGSTLIDGIEIVSDVTVGAGAVVTSSILEPGTYVGVPAKRIK